MIRIYTDGVTRPTNPGHGGYGFCVTSDGMIADKIGVKEENGYLGNDVTNNQCEYIAVCAALNHLLTENYYAKESYHPVEDNPIIYTDSTLVVEQLRGNWVMKSPKLRPLWQEVKHLQKSLKEEKGIDVQVEYVPGHSGNPGNERADKLAGLAIDYKTTAGVYVRQLLVFSKNTANKRRGHVVLMEYVKDYFNKRNIPTIEYPAITDKYFREELHRVGRVQSDMLLRSPHLISIFPSGPALIATQTSFIRKQGEAAVRVMMEDMAISLTGLADAGHNVYIIHKPYANGRWLSSEELDWNEGDAQTSIIAYPKSVSHTIVTNPPSGWGDTLTINGYWTPLSEWFD